MNILIVGSTGMLGKDLADILSVNHKIINPNSKKLDITNLNDVISFFDHERPELIINAAAYTDVDGAESDVDNAYRINAIGPRNLAIASNMIDCPILQFSTDYVFNGKGEKPYKEQDKTNPLGVYGKTKYYGEENIKNLTNKFYIVRTSWLYGENGSNFPKTMINLSKSHDEIKVVDDQIGSPTFTKDLAIATSKLIEKPAFGTYHITNSGSCSWYEFASKIFDLANIDIDIRPVSSNEFKRPASRPNYSVLDNYHWRLEGFKEIRNYELAITEFLDSLNL